MVGRSYCSICLILLGVALESASASAEDSAYQVTAGVKLGAGGNYLGPPDDKPATTLPFDDGVGGWGLGGGGFAEIRILHGHLGAELDLIFDSSHNWSRLTYSSVLEYRLGWSATDLRIPLLINAGTGNQGTRLAFGTGPEFVVALGAAGKVENTNGNVPFSAALNAKSESHVNWAFNAGLAAPLGPVKLTFDIRFTLNLSTPDQYADRYDLVSGTVTAVHRMDLRLLLGVAYDVIR